MKGDINLKINKKMGLAILASLGVFAMADYVSLINAKDSGGIIYEKETMTVGAIVLRLDDTNPADIYGGTWELIREDATFGFGDGSDYSSSAVVGDNNPLVPLKEHDHSINHDHPSANTSSANTHRLYQVDITTTDGNRDVLTLPSSGWSGYSVTGGASGGAYAIRFNNLAYGHAHSLNLPNFTGTSGKEGVSNPTMDVRGARLMVNVWKRVS